MDIFDKVKKLLGPHADKLEEAVDKAAEVIDEKTSGKHSDRIEKGADTAKNFLSGLDGDEAQADEAQGDEAQGDEAQGEAEGQAAPPTDGSGD